MSKRGDKYKEDDAYVPNTQILYCEPDFETDSGYTYMYSGEKKVYDYQIVKKTLWLKVSIRGDDEEIEYYWIPAPADND